MRRLLLVLLSSSLLFAKYLEAQIVVATTHSIGWQFGSVTFNLKNSTPTPRILTDLASGVMNSGAPRTYQLWMKPGAINGAPGVISVANGWTQVATQTIPADPILNTATPTDIFSGMSVVIPANSTYGMCVVGVNTNVTFANPIPALNEFENCGMTIITGDPMSFVGGLSPTTPNIGVYGFCGKLTFAQLPFDLGLGLTTPSSPGCLVANQSVKVRVTNLGANTSTNVPVNAEINSAMLGTVNLSGVIPGPIAPCSFVDYTFPTTVDMSANGNYSVKVYVGPPTDNNRVNDTVSATRTNFAFIPLPYSENFEAGGIPPGYTGNANYNTAFGQMHGKNGTKGMFFNLWSGATSFTATLPTVGTFTDDGVFSFDYRIVNRTGYLNPGATATNILSDDSLSLYMSNDCGFSFEHVKTITGVTHTASNLFKNEKILIKGRKGLTPIFRFVGKYSVGSGGDYFVDIDNINIYNDTNDFLISAVLNPAPGSCFKSETDVKVVIKNNGTSFQSNIPIHAEFAGIINPPVTFSAIETDTLFPGQSDTITLGQLSTTDFGAIDYKIFTNFLNEDIRSNDTIIATAFVTEPVMIIPDDTIVCKFECANLFALGSGNHLWSDGQATILISACPTETGVYWVAASDANNCPDTAYQRLKVVLPPNVTAADDSACKGAFGTLSASGALSYDWGSFGANKKMSDNPTTTTSYSVIGTNAYGCKDTATATIYIKDLPMASASNDSVCEGKTATLIASGGLWYNWGIYGNNPFINVNVTKTTKYPVEVIGANGCKTVVFATAAVRQKPTIVVDNPVVCLGTSALINASGGVTYNWGTYGTQSSVNIPNVTSNMSIPLTVTDQFACTNSTNALVTVKQGAPLNLKDVTMCKGATASITANTYVVGAIYDWGVLGTGQTKSISPLVSTTYNVTATDPNGCDTKGQVKVTVKEKLLVKIDELPFTVCDNIRTLNLTAQPNGGYFSGVNVSFATFYPKIGQIGSHKIYYTYTEENSVGCNGSDSFEIVVKNCKISSIQSMENVESIKLAPNPFNNQFKVSLNLKNQSNYSFTLIDVIGHVIDRKVQDLNSGENEIYFSTQDLPAGAYYLNVTSGEESIHLPLIKE